MKRFVLILVVLFCLPQLAFAQIVKIVRQDCGPLRCRFEIGSGVVIGRSGAADGSNTYRILTAYHVCGNRWDSELKQRVRPGHDYKMQAVTPAGRFPAQIAAWNGDAMLMLLTIDVPAGLPEINAWPIADALPTAGDAVTIHGFSHTRNCQYGSRYLLLRSVGTQRLETTEPFEQGESGGPIVKDGKIVGLCDGYYDDTKCGYGPSIVAIRWFLGLPAIGSRREGEQSGLPVRGSESETGVPASPGLSVPRPGSVVPVPEPPVPKPGTGETGSPAPATGSGTTPTPAANPNPRTEPDAGGDAPIFTPPIDIAGVSPKPEPDPISNPPASKEPNGDSSAVKPAGPDRSPSVAKVARTAAFGLDLWSTLAGAGLVAGTGGIGGLALLAWRGLKAGKAVAHVVRNRRMPGPIVSPFPDRRPSPVPTANVIPPKTPLTPQNVNFVEVPTDFRRQSVDFALAETGRRYPGAIATVEVIKSLINQHLQASGHGQETLHS